MADIDYGPLAGLIGTWKGDKGLDVSPEPDGPVESPYYETLECVAAGDVENYEQQKLAIVRYHQVVTRKSNDEVFHDQVGYFLWDAASQTVMQTVTIPRGVCVTAGGTATGDGPIVLHVKAALGDADWGVAQSPMMRDNASTVAFEHEITLDGDTLRYAETTTLAIYGEGRFAHTDTNELTRV